jgi:hypothetical protein
MIVWLNGTFGCGKTTAQTIHTRAYLEQIFAGLRETGLRVFHVLLDADEPTWS